MKKLLSVLLVVAMLVTSCLFLGSCNKVKAKDIEKNPSAALNEAMDNATGDFFKKDEAAQKVFDAAAKKGAYTIIFEAKDGMLGEISKISETVYVENNEKFVSDTAVTISGQELAARIFMDKNGYIVTGEDLFGDSTALALNYTTLATKLKDSALAEMLQGMGMEDADVDEMVKMLTKVQETVGKTAEENEAKLETLMNEIYVLMGQTVADESHENAEGKKTKYSVVTYTLDNAKLQAIMTKLVDEYIAGALDAETLASMKKDIEESMKDAPAINLTAKLYINRKANVVEKLTVDGKITSEEDGEKEEATVALTLTFGETEIALNGNVNANKQNVTVDVKLTKEEKDGGVTYKLAANAGMKSEGGVNADINLANLTVARAKDGAVSITADIYQDEDSRIKLEVGGKLEITKDEVKLTVNSVKMDGESLGNFTLTLSAKAVSEIPAAPANTTDVVDMDQAAWEAIAGKIMNSKLGKLLEEIM